MGYRTMVVEAVDGAAGERCLRAAEVLALRFDAVLVGAHVSPPPYMTASQFGEATIYLGPELQAMQRRSIEEIDERVAATFKLVCGSAPTRLYHELEGARGEQLALLARTSDLAIVGRSHGFDPAADLAVVEHLALSAGVPVLTLPATVPEQIGQNVLIGWDGSREAARAAHDALPFVTTARRVVLCTIGEDPPAKVEDAAAMLRRHGLAIQPEILKIERGSPGRVLCEQAQNLEADLLVMGAYGHARLREVVFGGATHHALNHATVPVLFSS